jgi:chitinase domain-containing protein 1
VAVALGGVALSRAIWHVAAALREFRGAPAMAVDSSVVARNLVTRRTSAESIVEEHDRYFRNTSLKMTESVSIAMLTGEDSWRESFRLAARNVRKFTHVAPAWFSIEPDGRAVAASESWLVRVAAAELFRSLPARALVPIFTFRHLDLKRALPADNGTHAQIAERLALLVARRCERSWGCDGALIDAHVALRRRGARARPFIGAFVRALSARLRGNSRRRELLLLVPAHDSDAFSRQDVAELHEHVDGFIVQSYGFSSPQRPGPDAPLPWMMHALQGLMPSDAESASVSGQKLIASLRMGGHDFRLPHGGGPLCNRTRYLELLREHSPRLDWYSEASEHVFAYTDERNASRSVYHPTLKSLHDRLTAIRSWGVGLALDELHCGLDYFFDLL